ncbi:protein phosphatase regulatory subunit Sds22 [Blastocladiella emersonii ATCC 22665]|nr:protein phosphatase regulatory subunit Sds22 [Blastocladiella emersonii ATCC 22665]
MSSNSEQQPAAAPSTTEPETTVSEFGAVRVVHSTKQAPSNGAPALAAADGKLVPVSSGGPQDQDDDDEEEEDHSGDEAAAAPNGAGAADDDVQVTTVHPGEDVDESEFLAEVPDDVPELDLTHCRLRDMSALGLARFTHLERLGMRQNLFPKIDGVEALAPTLRELDLYDNRIAKFHALEPLVNLEVLDLSFNKIKRIPVGVLAQMKNLTDLYFVANKLAEIEGLEGLESLRNLELGANRIRTIQGLEHVPRLEQLWLGKNKITSLQGLGHLQSLRLLSIQSNRIVDLAGLEHLANLEELYLSHNGVLRIEHLEHNPKLRVLDLCNNRIAKLEGVKHLVHLEELWLSNNKLDDWTDVENETKGMPNLETIYLEGNPLQAAAGATYRLKVKTLVPQVKQIDAQFVRA